MSKKMTPSEKLGYKVGDEFEVIEDSVYFKKGDVVSLKIDDNSSFPFFINEKVVREGYSKGCAMYLYSVKKISKLKPAKQALADAIHQNGGWCQNADWSSVDRSGLVAFFNGCKPTRDGDEWLDRGDCEYVAGLLGCGVIRMPNWHQCILSRDEYFTAYPGQVKVEIDNETEHKVEVEMKSESEMTIKVSDWHKNGELPPVGEVCEAYIDYPPQWIETEIVAHKDGFAIGWCKSVMKGCHGDKAHEFRPLRTEREVAIDEMMRVAAENWGNLQDCCERLYEYGYRKEAN